MDELYRFFVFRLGSRADAEDLAQATLEHAFRAWGRYDPRRASVRTWLLAIAGNLLIDHYRGTPARRHDQLENGAEDVAHVDRVDDGLEPALEAALRRLDPREREMLALRFGADLSGPEIAALKSLSLANVHQIMSRALRQLRADLKS